MRVLVRTCGGSEVATLDAELSWRKEDVLAALPARTHDLPCEERVLIAGKELCGIMTLLEKLEASCTIRVACASDSLLKEFRHEKQSQCIHVASGVIVDTIVFAIFSNRSVASID